MASWQRRSVGTRNCTDEIGGLQSWFNTSLQRRLHDAVTNRGSLSVILEMVSSLTVAP
jgi:hypothetical protein